MPNSPTHMSNEPSQRGTGAAASSSGVSAGAPGGPPSQSSDIVSALAALGFSLNESRAYGALLQESPATGYEVGVRAQIPRSAVYGVLRRLVAQGAARSIAGTPERFAPAPADELILLLRKRFDASTSSLEEAIRQIDTTPRPPDAFTVTGYERVMEEAERVVRSAEEKLVVSGWPRELRALANELKKATKRHIVLVVFSHATLSDIPGDVFSYELDEAALEDFWKHRLIVVADDVRTLIGATERSASDNAVISETRAIAEVAVSQVALDITLLAQRKKQDVNATMAKMLGNRVGRLDSLLSSKSRGKPA